MSRREDILERVLAERVRQFDLPGTELDTRCTPNDWIATITRLVSEESNSRGRITDADSFEESLIRCAAVVVAALEHVELMKEKGLLL